MPGLSARYPGLEIERLPLLSWYGREALLKVAANPRVFDRCFRNMPISDQERVFAHVHQCFRRVTVRELLGSEARDYQIVTGLDPSSKRREGNALITCALNVKERTRFPVDVQGGAWDANQRIERLLAVNAVWNPCLIAVENNSMQQDFIDLLRDHPEGKTLAAKIVPLFTGMGKAEELGKLEVQFAQNMWVFPMAEVVADSEGQPKALCDHSAACTCWWCRLFTDLRDYTRDYEGTFDLGMALFFCAKLLEGAATPPMVMVYEGLGDGSVCLEALAV